MKAKVIYKDAAKQAALVMAAHNNALQYVSRGGKHTQTEYIAEFYGNRVIAQTIR